jgi:hypothetical protein
MNAESKIFNALRATAMGAALSVAAVTSFAAPSPADSAARSRTTPVIVDVPAPQSVFVDRPDFGRDPFFPKSRRRGEVAPTNSSPVEPTANFNNIVLKGISVNSERRLAILNNKTFEVGEEGEIRVNGQPVSVKIAEIRDKSVVIIVNGVSKELFLGSRF